MGDCQNYGPFLGPYYITGPNLGDPKRDHNFDNSPYGRIRLQFPKLVQPSYSPTKPSRTLDSTLDCPAHLAPEEQCRALC